MDNERLDILMGKFFDGEIEPSEQRLLDAQLAKDPQSRRLFDEFQSLHALAQAEVTPLAEQGRPFEAVFAAAWAQSRRNRPRRIGLPVGALRFAAGLAAGLLLAVLIQWASGPGVSPQAPVAAGPAAPDISVTGPDRIVTRAAGDAYTPVIKDVDYYYYIDENGQRWLIEGYRENIRTQLVSYQDL